MVQEAEKLKNNCPLSLVVNSITMAMKRRTFKTRFSQSQMLKDRNCSFDYLHFSRHRGPFDLAFFSELLLASSSCDTSYCRLSHKD